MMHYQRYYNLPDGPLMLRSDCDFASCPVFASGGVESEADGVAKLRELGWIVNQFQQFCPNHVVTRKKHHMVFQERGELFYHWQCKFCSQALAVDWKKVRASLLVPGVVEPGEMFDPLGACRYVPL